MKAESLDSLRKIPCDSRIHRCGRDEHSAGFHCSGDAVWPEQYGLGLRTVYDHGHNDIGTFGGAGGCGRATPAIRYEPIDGRGCNVTADHVNTGTVHGFGHPHPH
jgi:hypothetical protein